MDDDAFTLNDVQTRKLLDVFHNIEKVFPKLKELHDTPRDSTTLPSADGVKIAMKQKQLLRLGSESSHVSQPLGSE